MQKSELQAPAMKKQNFPENDFLRARKKFFFLPMTENSNLPSNLKNECISRIKRI